MLSKPLITEKTLRDAASKRYTFVVDLKATKTDIKREVEKLFGVNVIKVHTAIMPGKSYRSGKRFIFRNKSDWKKAVVSVKPDQKIDLFEVTGAAEPAAEAK